MGIDCGDSQILNLIGVYVRSKYTVVSMVYIQIINAVPSSYTNLSGRSKVTLSPQIVMNIYRDIYCK